ncbi:F-box/WD-40 repeat-containing protein [Actinidia chinensis var. chinensis]|uniref:F-box/WD-40 repeat-containing protein n=1 Tax=Actinidia chinensis var. chinensis TaxID=1590841 RepID=A0A2R6PFB3_ACTCC|nr:F-box/WD-40 repeat-containing protein [Actinidia chinensis var. chinensis]
MAFECCKTAKVDSSSHLVQSVDRLLGEQVEIESRRDKENSAFESEIENLEFESLKPTSEFRPKRGTLTSYNAKSLPVDEALLNYSRSITDLPPALISEILNCLEPKELGIVSCVSKSIYRLASEHHVWKEFYYERWGQPVVRTPLGLGYLDEKTWKELFVEREFRSKTFLGRYSIDNLYGHTEAVRTVFLLASKKLIFTSGYESIVRMWDMEEGLAIASSRPLGCTIRAVAADTKLLIAGGTDGFIHGWRAKEGLSYLFDLKGSQNQNTEFRLWEHEGPITCLALDLNRIYSGSWDMTVRVWDRSLLKCLKVLRHSDWVWSLVPHDTTVASVSGSDVYVWDSDNGSQIAFVSNVHVGDIYSLARSHTGKLLFTGGEDGAIHMFEIINHCGESNLQQVATWIPHSGPVYSLSFEFPWLVSASSDGKLSLIDVRKLLKPSRHAAPGNPKRSNGSYQKNVEPPQRMLHWFGSNLFSVDIGSDRVVCGGEEGVVRVWNFSQALEIEQRSRALRGLRLENRMRRRKLQIGMNGKGGCAEQCSVAAKNLVNGDRNDVWHNKRGVSSKLKA